MAEHITDLGQLLGRGVQFPPAGQKRQKKADMPARLDTYQTNWALFENQHDLAYGDWSKVMNQDDQKMVELFVNFHRRLSKLFKSLLLTEPPTFTHPLPPGSNPDTPNPGQDYLDDLVKRTGIVTSLGADVIDMSRYGTGLLKVGYREATKSGYVTCQPPFIGDAKVIAGGWFPVVDPLNRQDVTAHVLAFLEARRELVMGLPVNRLYLHAEIHERGKITNQTWLMDGQVINKLVEESETPTGVDDFLLVPAHNLLTSDRTWGVDDYTDIDSLVHEVELRLSQISKVLDKHSEPNMQGPHQVGATTGQTPGQAAQAQGRQPGGKPRVEVGGKYFGRLPEDPEVAYVTWDAQMEASFKELDVLGEWIFILSETSPAAFGQLKAGLAESGSALRRLLLAPLLKVSGMRNEIDTQAKKALEMLSRLEVAKGVAGAVVLDQVSIEWKDGLPQDKTEDANVEAVMNGAGLASQRSSISRVYGLVGDALDAEVQAIEAEQKADADSRAVPTLPADPFPPA